MPAVERRRALISSIWITLGVDLLWDLNWRLPFPDGVLKGIYTEHCMEHLPFELVTGHNLG